MSSPSVRASLRRACEEIEDVCETVPISADDERRLEGLAEQLRYLVDGSWTDPEAAVAPDPETLDTIREHLADVSNEAEGDEAARLERARDEVLLAISLLTDRQEKQRRAGNRPG